MRSEDFFTPSEMKEGLTANARVEELVSMMWKEKFSVVKNISEASRQWSTVARTLAATENKDNLERFIQLDGLYFLDQWLQEAQKSSNSTNDNTVEELIIALLGALKKLPVDNARSVTSGIRITVKNLLGHKSCRVQESAKVLLNNWNPGGDNDANHLGSEKKGSDDVVVKATGVTAMDNRSADSVEGSAQKDNHLVTLAGGELKHSRSSEGCQSESIEVLTSISKNLKASTTLPKREDRDREDAQVISTVTTHCQERPTTFVESATHPERVASIVTCCSPAQMESDVEYRPPFVQEPKGSNADLKDNVTIRSSPEKSVVPKVCSISISSVPEPVSSSTDPDNALQSLAQTDVLSNIDTKKTDVSLKNSPSTTDNDSRVSASYRNSEAYLCGVSKQLNSEAELKTAAQAVGCNPSVLQAVTINSCTLKKQQDPVISFSRKNDGEAVADVKGRGSGSFSKRRGDSSAIIGDISKSVVNNKFSDLGDDKRLDMELDFMVDDALEVARQVAKEVEKEVVDYREPFCSSSSEKTSADEPVLPRSPDSIDEEQLLPMSGSSSELPNSQKLTRTSTDGLDQPRSPDSITGEEHNPVMESPSKMPNSLARKSSVDGYVHPQGPDSINQEQQEPVTEPSIESANGLTGSPTGDNNHHSTNDEELSQVIEAAPELEVNTKKRIHDFDLNEAVSSEETMSSALPTAPLCFEGEQGWKGPAPPLGLLPASLCRTPADRKELQAGCLKQREDCRGIDLNLTGGDDFGTTDLEAEKQIPVSSSLPFGVSPVEVNSGIADRIKWDLNRIDVNEDAPTSYWRKEDRFLRHLREDRSSSSPAWLLPSMQPSRNIDLNDNPSYNDPYGRFGDLGKSRSLGMGVQEGFKQDNPVISIMGTRVEVNRKEFHPAMEPNRKELNPAIWSSSSSSSNGQVAGYPMGYASPYPSLSGWYGHALGSTVPSYPSMYGVGSIPYNVDTRGLQVAPPTMYWTADGASSYTRPFLLGMANAASSSSGSGHPRPTLDLNSGLTIAGGENRDSGGLRQPDVRGQGEVPDDVITSVLQPLSLAVGSKRKEPDTGGDTYPIDSKQKSPWQ